MATFNRFGSPMELCEENLAETRANIEKRKRLLEDNQRARSPFIIGTIDEVNRKISKLNRRLQSYTQLIADSRTSEHGEDHDLLLPTSARGRDKSERLERERKEVNRFAGMYCLKSTFMPGLSERARNISKISLQQSKTSLQSKKDTTGKPKFVELHQYPGFEQADITPLPDHIQAAHILRMVTEAAVSLDKKPAYKPEFEKLFYSDLSQAILQDLFWYMFLDKFQSSHNSQQQLFNRIAHNYVNLMMFAKHPQYRDTFFKVYPSLMSQAVYAAYCESFPDSYRQFGNAFKEDLLTLVTEWMAGIKPAPRSWMKWNLSKLEPENIKTREEILKQKDKKSTSMSFDFLDALGTSNSNNPSVYSSSSNVNQSSSKSSLFGSKRLKKKPSLLTVNSSHRVTFAQSTPSSGAVQQDRIAASSTPRLEVESKSSSESVFKQKGVDPRQLMEALTPIREMITEDETKTARKRGKVSATIHTPISISINSSKPKSDRESDKKESHPACKGPDFVRAVFNIHGQSPLMAHFLRTKKLESNVGTIVRVQLTELENLPPLDAPTYRDVIKQSFKNVKDIAKQHHLLLERGHKKCVLQHRKQRKVLQDHVNRESALLSKPREVKRLSDLLILEQKKGHDSISAGADAAIEAALIAQE